MLNNSTQTDTPLGDDVLELLTDLERNKSDEIKRLRASTRICIRSKVIAQPGNSGDRLKFKVQGVTGDLSAGGCQILFPIPFRVGDIYWLKFDKSEVDIDSVFGRCLRCRLIREDAYEAGFKFFEPIDVSSVVESRNAEALFA